MALFVCNLLNDDDCLHYQSRRNNVVIALGALSSFLSCWNPPTLSSAEFEQIEPVTRLIYLIKGNKVWGTVRRNSFWRFAQSEFQTRKKGKKDSTM